MKPIGIKFKSVYLQIRSEMKEVLKSPSLDPDQSPTSSVHLDHKTSLFHLSDSNTDSNELKASKGSGSSSDTQSFDEDSQGFPGKKATTATGAAAKKKPGRKSAADKESEKSLSKILGTDSALEKEMRVEVLLVDVGKKGHAVVGKANAVTVEKVKAIGEKAGSAGRKSTGEKIGLPVKQQQQQQEKVKVVVAVPGKAGAEEGSGEMPNKDEASDGDVYEFKEPEPFEFEAATTTSRKPMNTAVAVPVPEESKVTAGKGKKRVLELEAKTSTPQTTTPGKKVKRSPGKPGAGQEQSTPPEKGLIKREESGLGCDPFDVLRKSPNFNLSGGAENLPEFTQKLPSTEGFSNPVSSASAGLGSGLSMITGLANSGGPMGSGIIGFSTPLKSSVVSSAFVNTRNDDDQWQSLRMFKSVVEGQIDMEDVLAKTKVSKEVLQQKGGDFSDSKSSIADKFLKTLNHGGSSNSSSPSSSGEGSGGGGAPTVGIGKATAGSIFGRDFADKLEPKMLGKKEHLKLELLSTASGKQAGGLAGSPDKLDTMLELNPPKNNDLSETIQKLKSAIDEEDDVEADESTDSERERLVIEDEDAPMEDDDEEDDEVESKAPLGHNNGPKELKKSLLPESLALSTELTLVSSADAAAAAAVVSGMPVKIKDEVTISSVTLKEQSKTFASKFQESFYGSQTSGGMIKLECSEMDLTCKESFDDEACEVVDKKDVSITLVSATSSSSAVAKTLSNVVSVSMTTTISGGGGGDKDPDSLSLLLCEETIPTSPWHRGLSDKSLIEERKGTLESRLLSGVKSLGQTPNSSPRDSQSPDDSKSDSEDLKKTGKEREVKEPLPTVGDVNLSFSDAGDSVSVKKRRRGAGRRSPDLDASAGKRRRLGAGSRKGSAANIGAASGGGQAGNGGSDSEENSDPLSSRQQLLGRRSPKPCQYNFLVQLGELVVGLFRRGKIFHWSFLVLCRSLVEQPPEDCDPGEEDPGAA